MRDKIASMAISETVQPAQNLGKDISAEAESALTALGYRPQDAAKMISRVAQEDIETAEQLIRAALKTMI
jgi:Holliday junction DNA helicase RuvA